MRQLRPSCFLTLASGHCGSLEGAVAVRVGRASKRHVVVGVGAAGSDLVAVVTRVAEGARAACGDRA